MDIPLALISVALLTTLTGFISGVFPYPYGLMLLSLFLVARLLQLSGRR